MLATPHFRAAVDRKSTQNFAATLRYDCRHPEAHSAVGGVSRSVRPPEFEVQAGKHLSERGPWGAARRARGETAKARPMPTARASQGASAFSAATWKDLPNGVEQNWNSRDLDLLAQALAGDASSAAVQSTAVLRASSQRTGAVDNGGASRKKASAGGASSVGGDPELRDVLREAQQMLREPPSRVLDQKGSASRQRPSWDSLEHSQRLRRHSDGKGTGGIDRHRSAALAHAERNGLSATAVAARKFDGVHTTGAIRMNRGMEIERRMWLASVSPFSQRRIVDRICSFFSIYGLLELRRINSTFRLCCDRRLRTTLVHSSALRSAKEATERVASGTATTLSDPATTVADLNSSASNGNVMQTLGPTFSYLPPIAGETLAAILDSPELRADGDSLSTAGGELATFRNGAFRGAPELAELLDAVAPSDDRRGRFMDRQLARLSFGGADFGDSWDTATGRTRRLPPKPDLLDDDFLYLKHGDGERYFDGAVRAEQIADHYLSDARALLANRRIKLPKPVSGSYHRYKEMVASGGRNQRMAADLQRVRETKRIAATLPYREAAERVDSLKTFWKRRRSICEARLRHAFLSLWNYDESSFLGLLDIVTKSSIALNSAPHCAPSATSAVRTFHQRLHSTASVIIRVVQQLAFNVVLTAPLASIITQLGTRAVPATATSRALAPFNPLRRMGDSKSLNNASKSRGFTGGMGLRQHMDMRTSSSPSLSSSSSSIWSRMARLSGFEVRHVYHIRQYSTLTFADKIAPSNPLFAPGDLDHKLDGIFGSLQGPGRLTKTSGSPYRALMWVEKAKESRVETSICKTVRDSVMSKLSGLPLEFRELCQKSRPFGLLDIANNCLPDVSGMCPDTKSIRDTLYFFDEDGNLVNRVDVNEQEELVAAGRRLGLDEELLMRIQPHDKKNIRIDDINADDHRVVDDDVDDDAQPEKDKMEAGKIFFRMANRSGGTAQNVRAGTRSKASVGTRVAAKSKEEDLPVVDCRARELLVDLNYWIVCLLEYEAVLDGGRNGGECGLTIENCKCGGECTGGMVGDAKNGGVGEGGSGSLMEPSYSRRRNASPQTGAARQRSVSVRRVAKESVKTGTVGGVDQVGASGRSGRHGVVSRGSEDDEMLRPESMRRKRRENSRTRRARPYADEDTRQVQRRPAVSDSRRAARGILRNPPRTRSLSSPRRGGRVVTVGQDTGPVKPPWRPGGGPPDSCGGGPYRGGYGRSVCGRPKSMPLSGDDGRKRLGSSRFWRDEEAVRNRGRMVRRRESSGRGVGRERIMRKRRAVSSDSPAVRRKRPTTIIAKTTRRKQEREYGDYLRGKTKGKKEPESLYVERYRRAATSRLPSERPALSRERSRTVRSAEALSQAEVRQLRRLLSRLK